MVLNGMVFGEPIEERGQRTGDPGRPHGAVLIVPADAELGECRFSYDDIKLIQTLITTPATPEGILHFTREYGLLSDELQFGLAGGMLSPAMSLEYWRHLQTGFRRAWSLAITMSQGAKDTLRALICEHIRRTPTYVGFGIDCDEKGRLVAMPADSSGWVSGDWARVLDRQAATEARLRSFAFEAAQDILTEHANTILEGHAAPRILSHRAHVVALTLIGHCWLQIHHILTSESRLRYCAGCGALFDSAGGRSDRITCSPRCRKNREMRAYRASRKRRSV